jgi:alcohol dehydrogenase (cytochrome c)
VLRQRRAPAVFAVVASALALWAALAAAQPKSDTPANPFANDPTALNSGRAVYTAACITCHGIGGVGSERAPSLNTGSFAHGGEDYQLFQTIHSGIPGSQMPSFSNLPADDIWRLVIFVKSFSAQAGGPSRGDAKAGEALFFSSKGGCSNCHEVNGRGRALAADLSAEGVKADGLIRVGVLHNRAADTRTVDLTLSDGRKVHGVLKAQDVTTVHVQTADAKLLMLDRAGVASMTDLGRAAPADIATRLSHDDIENLVAYLALHKARDLTQTAKVNPAPVLPYARIVDPAPGDWPSYWGDVRGHHFSALTQITAANVGQLQARWAAPMLGDTVMEATPIVVDGVMYMAGPPGDVAAFDARSGLPIWRFHRKQDVKNPYQINPFNKGVAVLDGRVFFGTLDNKLIALDAHTGRELWEETINDTMSGYTITGAPLALKDKLIVGMSGGEMGIRGYLEAYDPADGHRLWRFYTIPAPGEPGGDTWAGDSWKYGGGPTWLTGSYDPETNALIWGVGNPGPDFNPDLRKGDNLYTDSVLALDADSGKLKWFYQFTPNDGHDWDSTEDMVLADQVIDGQPRKLVIHADRNGMFYVLDRTNGKFLWSKPFVRQTWNLGFDAKGRPIVDPKSVPTKAGQSAAPLAATNFGAPSYDQDNGLLYLPYNDASSVTLTRPDPRITGQIYVSGTKGPPPTDFPPDQGVEAIDTHTGAVVWKFHTNRFVASSGVLATRGGVVFVATPEGQFLALDGKTGKRLWDFHTGQAITASPMSYAVDGRQFIAVAAGNLIYSFALPKPN